MARGSAAFIFKVESELSGSDLKEDIKNKIVKNAINPDNNNESKRGFMNLNVEPEDYVVERPQFYFNEIENKLIALYREYTTKYDKYDGTTRTETNDINTLYDINKRILIFRTSYPSDVNKLIRIFSDSEKAIRLRSPRYIGNENFLRWVITNAKDGREKLPNPCKLENIEGVRVQNLQDSVTYATTESIAIHNVEDISSDHFYEPIKEEGTRPYIKGRFYHSRWMYSITIHNNGKITLGKRPDNVEDYHFFSMFGVAFEEMENIYQSYLDDVGE